MKKTLWMWIALLLVGFMTISGCVANPFGSDTPSTASEIESAPSDPSSQADPPQENLPAEISQRIQEGWKVPTHADLQGTAWGWDEYQDELGYFSKLVSFNEWTVDVIWHDGMDENAHTYPEAAYELTCEKNVATLEINFREMAGKLSYYLLLSPESDAIYTLEIPLNTDSETPPASAVLAKKKTANYMELIGRWDRTRTLAEGDEVETEPNTCTIEISGETKDNLTISYTSADFPQKNYSEKALIYSLGALPVYTNCGNDVWYANIDYVGEFNTTYAITLLEDGTLLLQNYFTMDGAPAVTYEWFRRVS